MGADLAARPLVAGGALAVQATEARGCVAGSITFHDVDGVILTEHARKTRDQRRSQGPKFECGGQSPRGAIEMNAREQWQECGGVVKRPFTAAARVRVLGATALRGGSERARGTRDRAFRAELSNLARITRKYVGRVVAGATRLAGLLALVSLVLAGGASVAEGSARGGRNETGGAVSTVGWVGAPSNRTGLPRSARLARRAVFLADVWVERAGGARREGLPQARCSFCRTRATAWTVAALGRADVLAQLAHWALQAACASLVRVVGTGCARNAACLHQAGDADGKVCPGRTQEWMNGRSWAVLSAAVALATTSVLLLFARVAEVASRARVRTAGEVHYGQTQRRWRDPQAERAVNGGTLP
eukprot:scaffold57308_cov59-Phaeocystis_antarctica.AAC.1